MIASGFISNSFPPSVAKGELDTGIHAWVPVAETGARDMDGVGAKIDRTIWVDVVVETHPSLWGEVPYTGVGVGTGVGVSWEVEGSVGWVLVVGPEEASGGLCPVGEAVGAGEVPPEDGWRERDASEGSSDGEGRRAGELDIASGAPYSLEGWRVGLPEREEFGGEFEISVQPLRAYVWGNYFAEVSAGHEEAEATSVFCDAKPALDERAELPGADGVADGIGGSAGGLGIRRRGQDCEAEDCYSY
jgi:hypothetical protein